LLWGYFDESGEHEAASGRLARLTFGGGIAPFEAWEMLSMEWAAMLEEVRVPMFHMADFEARQPPFREWPEGKRRRVLNALLDIAITYVPTFLGYTATPGCGKPALQDAYESNVAKLIKDAAIETFHSQEPMTLVFAKHKQFSATKISRYFDLWNDGDGRLTFGGVADPLVVCPLQVSDIVAYELSREIRQVRPEQMRYPLRRLAKEARSCKLTWF
jgi:hypothetical protein